MINNIKNNTISETDAKKNLNTLNKIKNVEIIKYKKRTTKHKELLNLFNDLSDIILTDKTLEPKSQENENENEKVERRKEENEKVESRKEENEYENEDDDYKNENEDDYENEYDDEAMGQNEENEIIKDLNNNLDEIIDKSKLFEEQIESLKKIRRSKRVLAL